MPEWGGERLCLGGGSSDVGAVGRGCQAAGGGSSGRGGLGGFVVSIRCCSALELSSSPLPKWCWASMAPLSTCCMRARWRRWSKGEGLAPAGTTLAILYDRHAIIKAGSSQSSTKWQHDCGCGDHPPVCGAHPGACSWRSHQSRCPSAASKSTSFIKPLIRGPGVLASEG